MKLFQTAIKIQNYMKKINIKETTLLKIIHLLHIKVSECSGMSEEIPGSSA